MNDPLSATRLTTYLQCARKYAFRYIEKIPPAFKPAALAFGAAVHSALQHFHERRAENETPEAGTIVGLFLADFEAQQVDDLRFKEGEDAGSLRQLGEALIRAYVAENATLNVRAAEAPFEVPLADPTTGEVVGPNLRGVFDLLLPDDVVVELKTAARRYDEAALAGPGLLDFRRCYEPGHITILDFGGAPLGAEGARKALAALVLTRLFWAGFAAARPDGSFTVVVADELQEALVASTIRHVERVVTTGRSFGLGLVSVHQSAPQLPTELQTILATNASLRVIGRSGEADARSALEWLPRTGLVPKPRLPGAGRPERPEYMSEAEEARLRVAEVGRLERQVLLVADRGAPFQARRVRAPHFDPPSWDVLRRRDAALVDRVLRGAEGVPREVLVQRARVAEERAMASLLRAERRDVAAAEGGPDVRAWKRSGGDLP